MAIKNEARYSKLLVAKYSPKNGCNVSDGTILYLKPSPTVPSADFVDHTFVSTEDGATESKYGWVKDVEPFSTDDFVISHLGSERISEEEKKHLEIMFTSIANLKAGTPVVAEYSCRGVERRSMKLTVHRVIFYPETT